MATSLRQQHQIINKMTGGLPRCLITQTPTTTPASRSATAAILSRLVYRSATAAHLLPIIHTHIHIGVDTQYTMYDTIHNSNILEYTIYYFLSLILSSGQRGSCFFASCLAGCCCTSLLVPSFLLRSCLLLIRSTRR
jgi:hypothetical protein